MSEYINAERIAGNKKIVVGDKYCDIVLKTLGRVYVQTGRKTELLSEFINAISESASKEETSNVITIRYEYEFDDLKYPGDNKFVFVSESQNLYISFKGKYLPIIAKNEAEVNWENLNRYFVAKRGDTMLGQLTAPNIKTGTLASDSSIFINELNKPPLYINSRALVENLNSDYLGGYQWRDFAKLRVNEKITGEWEHLSPTTFSSNVFYGSSLQSKGGFASGFSGYGWMLDSETNTLTVDNLVVRKIMHVYELVVNKISATNGSLWVTDSAKIEVVKPMMLIEKDEFTNELIYINAGTGYRFNSEALCLASFTDRIESVDLNKTVSIKIADEVNKVNKDRLLYSFYFRGPFYRIELDADNAKACPFRVNDIVRCQRFIDNSIKYYDAIVTDIRYVSLNNQGNYIILRTSDILTDIIGDPSHDDVRKLTEPSKGDGIVRTANISDISRQGAIYLTSNEFNSPYIDICKNMNRPDFSVLLPYYNNNNKLCYHKPSIMRLGNINGIKDPAFGANQPKGMGMVAENTYIKGQFVQVQGESEYPIPIYKGEYSPTETYYFYDYVIYNKVSYICIKRDANGDPSTSVGVIPDTVGNTDWKVYIEGVKGDDGITYYTWIRYADDINGNGISDNPINKSFMGLAYKKTTPTESNIPSDYTWTKFRGENGTDGIPGPPGKDGQTTYTWIAYSDHADGSNMYQIPNANTLYIGIATNKLTATESNVPSDYTWSKFKGDDGIPGTTGPFMMFDGEWSNTKQYYIRRDGRTLVTVTASSVKSFYQTKTRTEFGEEIAEDANRLTAIPIGSSPTEANSKYWIPFGGQFTSVATELLLAEKAILAGFIFYKDKLISAKGTIDGLDSTDVFNPKYIPNLSLDGLNGSITAITGNIGGWILSPKELYSREFHNTYDNIDYIVKLKSEDNILGPSVTMSKKLIDGSLKDILAISAISSKSYEYWYPSDLKANEEHKAGLLVGFDDHVPGIDLAKITNPSDYVVDGGVNLAHFASVYNGTLNLHRRYRIASDVVTEKKYIANLANYGVWKENPQSPYSICLCDKINNLFLSANYFKINSGGVDYSVYGIPSRNVVGMIRMEVDNNYEAIRHPFNTSHGFSMTLSLEAQSYAKTYLKDPADVKTLTGKVPVVGLMTDGLYLKPNNNAKGTCSNVMRVIAYLMVSTKQGNAGILKYYSADDLYGNNSYIDSWKVMGQDDQVGGEGKIKIMHHIPGKFRVIATSNNGFCSVYNLTETEFTVYTYHHNGGIAAEFVDLWLIDVTGLYDSVMYAGENFYRLGDWQRAEDKHS